jgi:hypothetical protein
LKDNQSSPRKIVVEQILSAIAGAIAGAVTGLISGLFIATVGGGDNDLMFGFLAIYSVPGGVLIGLVLGAVAGILLNRYPANTEHRKFGFAVLVVGLPTIVLGMLWLINTRHAPPSDRSLLANFERHEAILNQLVNMVQADRDLPRLEMGWTSPIDLNTIGVSAERTELYRQLLKEAHVSRGFYTQRANEEVDFSYWGVGSAISDDILKGYAYLVSPPAPVVPTLDGYRPKSEHDGRIKVYRHIRGNWYLYYEFIPG